MAPAPALQAAAARRRDAAVVIAERCDVLASACEAIAQRFAAGGTLFAFGAGVATSDAAHVAVEFVHPAIVGKRSLPAVALSADATGDRPDAVYADQIRLLARAGDIAIGIDDGRRDGAVAAGVRAAAERGLLTVSLTGGEATDEDVTATDFALRVPSDDPLVVKEVHVTAYHMLWELVHVHLDHCNSEVCLTCGDVAVEARVLELLDDGLAVVDAGAGAEEISVALVTPAVGDTVLAHAKEAIALVARAAPQPEDAS